MLTLARWMAGWGAGFVPAALMGAVGVVTGSPDAWIVAWVSSGSAMLFGLLGSLGGAWLRDALGAATLTALPAGILGFFGLMGALFSDVPFLATAALVGALLPPPIAAGSTAWLLSREEAA